MTDVLRIVQLNDSAVAALTVNVTKADGTSGNITIRTVAQMTPVIMQADCPLLQLNPQSVQSLAIVFDSFGADSAKKTAKYNLSYDFFFAPVGQATSLFEQYVSMVNAAAALVVALNQNAAAFSNNGGSDVTVSAPHFGAMTDGNGTEFHGCTITLAVTDYLES